MGSIEAPVASNKSSKVCCMSDLTDKSKSFEQYFLENCVNILLDAQRIRRNPALQKAVAAELDKRMKDLQLARTGEMEGEEDE